MLAWRKTITTFAGKIIAAELPRASIGLTLPYDLYSDHDSRAIAFSTSRPRVGCPFTCEFCLSSLDIPVACVLRFRAVSRSAR